MDEVCTPAYQEMVSAAKVLGKGVDHARGDFPALAAGISFGGGQQVRVVYLLAAYTTDIAPAPW
jgi:hypothetical protein